MKPSIRFFDLIKDVEGFSPVMYYDTGGLPTIGYGTLIDEADEQWLLTATITEEQGQELMLKELIGVNTFLNKVFRNVNLTQSQYDALCSFTYNVGQNQVRKSTLLRKALINPNDPTIRQEFARWKYDNGKVIPGLITRRKKESNLYFSENIYEKNTFI